MKLLILIILSLITLNLYAQEIETNSINNTCNCCDNCPAQTCPDVNCDEPQEEKDPWENSFNFGYNKTDGNSDTSLLNLKLSSVYDKEKNQFRFEAEHSFGESDDDTNVDYSKVLSEYKRIITDLLYLGFGTQFLRDEIADVKYRVSINPALGYYLYKNDADFFSIEAGPTYLWEEVANIEDDYLAARIGERLEFAITDTAKVFQHADFIFSTDDSDNYIIQAEAGIETTITEMLSLIFKVRDNYDNQPAPGNKKNDIAVITSLGVGF